MTWITQNNLIAAGIVLASVMIVGQVIKYGMLLYRRMKIKDYNKFVHMTYTQYAKETPAIILRIQNDYILRYNNLLRYCRFLSNFFKEIGYFDGTPGNAASLLADGPNNEEPARLESI